MVTRILDTLQPIFQVFRSTLSTQCAITSYDVNDWRAVLRRYRSRIGNLTDESATSSRPVLRAIQLNLARTSS